MTDAPPVTDPATIRAWLGVLHGDSPGLVHICRTGDWHGQTFGTDQLDQAAAYAAQLDAAGPAGVYVRMTTLRAPLPPGRRGGATDTHAVVALWADIDIAGPGHKTDESLPPDEAAARSIITEAHLPPATLWVHSGGGLYPIWLLDRPHVVDGDLDQVSALSAGWQAVIGAAAVRLGWHYGTGVGDLARVLRIPGTTNRKVPDQPRPCRIIDAAPARYSLEQLRGGLATAMAAVTPPPPAPERPATPPPAAPAPATARVQPVDAHGARVGDDFNARADWAADILEPAGWRHLYDRDGVQYWQRPGKTDQGTSATINANGTDRLRMFSDAMPELPGDTSYHKFATYALLHHRGDYAAATRALAAAGYGTSTTPAGPDGAAINRELMQLAGHDPAGPPPFEPRPGAADPPPGRANPGKYFTTDQGRKELLVATLAGDIAAMGPLAEGIDDRMWSYRDGVWSPDPHVVRNRTVALLGEQYRAGHRTNAEAVVKANAATITCDPVYEVINMRNGLYYWQADLLRDHDPTVMSTVQLAVDYDPYATCPEFDKFLSAIVPDDVIPTIWEMIGYLMLSGNPLHKAVMLIGKGRNGKGTLLRVIVALLGKHNVTSVSLHDLVNTRFTTASLFGKIANVAGDIDGTYLESTATLKAITGEDLISAEHKGRDRFDFTAWAVPVFSANKIPASADVTTGYLSRWLPIEFPNSFLGKEDPELSNKLMTKAELAGIATKALPALRRLMDRGRFETTASGEAAAAKFARHVDQVRHWLDECTSATPGHWEPRTELYRAYRAWIDREGGHAIKSGEFYERLESAGAQPLKHVGTRGFTGVRINAPEGTRMEGLT